MTTSIPGSGELLGLGAELDDITTSETVEAVMSDELAQKKAEVVTLIGGKKVGATAITVEDAYRTLDLQLRAQTLRDYAVYDSVIEKARMKGTVNKEGAFRIDSARLINYHIFVRAMFNPAHMTKENGMFAFVPRYDEFTDRALAHTGKEWDNTVPYPSLELVSAAETIGFHVGDFAKMERVIKELALHDNIYNSALDCFKRSLPEWDGEQRLRTFLSRYLGALTPEEDAFEGENELIVDMLEYLLKSLYYRVTNPGCKAPICIATIGVQNSGKSYFWDQLNNFSTGGDDHHVSPAITIDLEKEEKDIFRQINGQGTVAIIAEMKGFAKSDLNKVKGFVTANTDRFDLKFKGVKSKGRQWILGMDANKYEEFFLDKTGNRRFYPIFVGNGGRDENGERQQIAGFKTERNGFTKEIFWQLMAEIHASADLRAYEVWTIQLADRVFDFANQELGRGEGGRNLGRHESILADILPRLQVYLKKDRQKMSARKGSTASARDHGKWWVREAELLMALNDKANRSGSKYAISDSAFLELIATVGGALVAFRSQTNAAKEKVGGQAGLRRRYIAFSDPSVLGVNEAEVDQEGLQKDETGLFVVRQAAAERF